MARTERWVVRVNGDDSSLDRLADRLQEPGLLLRKENAEWHLSSSSFEDLTSSASVEQAVNERIFPLIALYGRMLGCSDPSLSVHSISELSTSGVHCFVTLRETIVGTVGIACWGRDPEQPKDSAVDEVLAPNLVEAAVKLALSEPTFQKVLREYAKCSPDADDSGSRLAVRRTIESMVGTWRRPVDKAVERGWLTNHERDVLDAYLYCETNGLHAASDATDKSAKRPEATTASAHRLLRKLLAAYLRDQCTGSASHEEG